MGWPFLILLLLTSVGLVLYMNFADGTKYNFDTGDAYLEVRDRDYFFQLAYMFFGVAIGIGVPWVCAALAKSRHTFIAQRYRPLFSLAVGMLTATRG